MRILVTGSSGQFGQRLMPALAQAGHTGVPFDIRLGHDACDREQVARALQGAQAVIHLAAIPWGRPDKSAKQYWQTNVQSTHVVAGCAAAKNVGRMILASSTGYYGFQRDFPFGDVPAWIGSANVIQRYASESVELPNMKDLANQGRIAYMTSKVAAEAALAMYSLAGLLHGVILRFAPVTPEVYEWGLQCTPERACAAMMEAIEAPYVSALEMYNIGEPCEMLDTEVHDD